MSRLHLSPPDVTSLERSLLLEAFDSGWVSTVGPFLEVFERDVAAMTGTAAAVALSSGTAGLHLALAGVGVGPGDDVLTSTFTFVATANAVSYLGARPVFVDSDTTSWNMDPDLLADELDRRARVGRLPAAVLVVDLYGQCADLARVRHLCDLHGVPLVEDAAEALGARCHGRPAGSWGDVGVVSFNGNKIATTSGGGAVVSDDVALVERIRHLATQARQPVLHYEHVDLGYNYRLSNLLAAVGTGQVRRLPDMIRRRHEINGLYRRLLDDVEHMPVPAWSEWNAWLSCILLPTSDEAAAVADHLAGADIECRPLWKPMHRQPLYRQSPVVGGGVSDDLFARGLCLPSGSALTDHDVMRVVSEIQIARTRHRRVAS